MCSSASGANPKHSFDEAMMPATNVPWLTPSSSVFSFVQFVRSLMRLKWGCDLARPVSNTATFTPCPVMPIPHNTSALSRAVIWRGIARSNRRFVCRFGDCGGGGGGGADCPKASSSVVSRRFWMNSIKSFVSGSSRSSSGSGCSISSSSSSASWRAALASSSDWRRGTYFSARWTIRCGEMLLMEGCVRSSANPSSANSIASSSVSTSKSLGKSCAGLFRGKMRHFCTLDPFRAD
uniref:Uncharacterized protein n=1 Tax=Anopheles christyi TaxID=43041 RepID=A0A182KI82_9DIPT